MANSKRKCRGCKKFYPPEEGRTVGPCFYCSIDCQMGFLKSPSGEAAVKKVANRNHAAKKVKLKSKTEWIKEAQMAFNSFIRERDKGKPCISCGKPDNNNHQRHASHYRSVGACTALRFNTKNVYASCATCNTILSGNLLEYRINLVKQYGPELVEWLESQNKVKRFDIDYLIRLKRIFKKRKKIYQNLNKKI